MLHQWGWFVVVGFGLGDDAEQVRCGRCVQNRDADGLVVERGATVAGDVGCGAGRPLAEQDGGEPGGVALVEQGRESVAEILGRGVGKEHELWHGRCRGVGAEGAGVVHAVVVEDASPLEVGLVEEIEGLVRVTGHVQSRQLTEWSASTPSSRLRVGAGMTRRPWASGSVGAAGGQDRDEQGAGGGVGAGAGQAEAAGAGEVGESGEVKSVGADRWWLVGSRVAGVLGDGRVRRSRFEELRCVFADGAAHPVDHGG